MRTTSLDILEKAQLPGGQAKAILTVMELELEDHRQTLATHAELTGVRTELKIDIADLRAEMRERFSDLRTELAKDMGKTKFELIQWMAGIGLTVAGLVLGVVYFYLNHVHH